MVTLGVSEYLPQTLQGLGAQTAPPDAVLVVDVTPGPDPGHGRTSALRTLAQESGIPLERVRVAHTPEAGTFGAAVGQGLDQLAEQGGGGAHLAGARWLWFLHDDSAPQPTALAELLRAAKSGPTVAIAGAKQRDWDEPERLLELGVTVSGTGRRFLGLEDGELDQGQHDNRVDVYGVGTAGALVVTDVWNALGGIDPALGPFGDGLDLCRRARLAGYRVVVAPRAVLHHARAGYRGLRPTHPRGRRPATASGDVRRSFRERRAALLHTRAVQSPGWALPLLGLVVLLVLPVRVLVRILTKEFRLAGDEVAAVAAVLVRPGAVRRARRQTHRVQRIPARRLRPLRATGRQAWRVARDRRLQAAAARRGRLVRSELELAERAALATRRRWTLTAVIGGLVLLAGVPLAHLLAAGPLTGGALLPLAGDIGSSWQRAVGAWSATADGEPGPADPFAYVMTALTAVAGGSPRLAVTALLVLALPLAALGAWFAAGAATRSVRLRAWAAVVWGVAPPLVLAVGQGRLGPTVAHLALPWVALGVARALGVQRRDEFPGVPTSAVADRGGSVAAASAAGLALAVAAAGAPALLVPALVTLLLVAVLAPRRHALLLLVAVPPVALLAPLLLDAVADLPGASWRVLVADPGVPFAAGSVASLAALLGWPVAPTPWPVLPEPAATVAPVVVSGVLVLGAVVALLRHGRLRAVRTGWAVVIVGLATAVGVSRVEVGVGSGVEGGTQLVRGWPGAATSLVVLGILVAVVAAADGLVRRLTSTSFGWRQVSAAVLAVLLVVAPLAAAVAWAWQAVEARNVDGPSSVLAVTGRGSSSPVPALGADLQRPPHAARVLALSPVGDELVVRLWRGDGDQFEERTVAVSVRAVAGPPGSAVVAEPDPAETHLADVVARLSLGAAGDPRSDLARHAVGVVVVPPGSGDARDRLVARLDATAGLERVTENSTGVVWRVAPEETGLPVARARVVDADGRALEVVPSHGTDARGMVGEGEPGRLLVLAERADAGWRAWLDGRPLPARSLDWQQAFALPTGGGEVTVTYLSWRLTLVHSAQAVVLGAFVVLALPLRRRRAGVS